MKRIFLLLAIFFILAGCSSTYDKIVAEAEVALEDGDFEKALKLYNNALEEQPNSSEAKDRIALLNDYDTLQEKMENYEWTEAADLAHDLLKNDRLVPSLQKEVKQLWTTVEEEKEKEEQIASELKEIEKLIDNEDVDKAQTKLGDLEKKIGSNSWKSEIKDLNDQLEVAQKHKAEKKKKRLAEEAKQQSAQANGLKEKYLQKADNLEHEIAVKARDIHANNPPVGFYGQYMGDWDNLLNEVWGVLKDTMPANEFEKLKADQIEWIHQVDEHFAQMPNDVAIQRAAGSDFLANETANRTYYLLNYMD